MPASAHECTASATIDADPVITAATDFATATSAFATSATIDGQQALAAAARPAARARVRASSQGASRSVRQAAPSRT